MPLSSPTTQTEELEIDNDNPLGEINTYEADKVTMGREDSAASRVEDIIKRDSPLMTLSKSNAKANMQSRGLLNSSMAEGAAARGVIETATPLGTKDADTSANFKFANQREGNAAKAFNAGAFNTARGQIEQGRQSIEQIGESGVQTRLNISEQGMVDLQNIAASGIQDRLNIDLSGEWDLTKIDAQGIQDRFNITANGEVDLANISAQGLVDLANIGANGQVDLANIDAQGIIDLALIGAKGVEDRLNIAAGGVEDRATQWANNQADLLEIAAAGIQDRLNLQEQGTIDLANITAQGLQDRFNINEKGEVDIRNIDAQGLIDLANIAAGGDVDLANIDAQGLIDLANIGARGVEDRLSLTKDGEIKKQLQDNGHLDRMTELREGFTLDMLMAQVKEETAIKITNLETANSQLLQSSQSAATMYSNHMIAMADLLANPDIPQAEKQTLINKQVGLLEDGLALVGAIGDLDFKGFIDGTNDTVGGDPAPPYEGPGSTLPGGNIPSETQMAVLDSQIQSYMPQGVTEFNEQTPGEVWQPVARKALDFFADTNVGVNAAYAALVKIFPGFDESEMIGAVNAMGYGVNEQDGTIRKFDAGITDLYGDLGESFEEEVG